MRRARGGGSRGAINRCAINRIARAGCTAPFRGISGALAPLHRSCGAMGRIPSAHGTDCRRECTGCWAAATGALRRMHRPCRANQPVHCAECTEAIAPMNQCIALNASTLSCQSSGALRRMHRTHRAHCRCIPPNPPTPSRRSTCTAPTRCTHSPRQPTRGRIRCVHLRGSRWLSQPSTRPGTRIPVARPRLRTFHVVGSL